MRSQINIFFLLASYLLHPISTAFQSLAYRGTDLLSLVYHDAQLLSFLHYGTFLLSLLYYGTLPFYLLTPWYFSP